MARVDRRLDRFDGDGTDLTMRGLITAADIPRWMADDDKRGRVVELRVLVKNWASFPQHRAAMIRQEPRRWRWYHRFTKRRRDLPRIAAVVHGLCVRDGVPVPTWVSKHRSRRPIAVLDAVDLNTPYGQLVIEGAPDVCREHNVWFSHEVLESISVHGFPSRDP